MQLHVAKKRKEKEIGSADEIMTNYPANINLTNW